MILMSLDDVRPGMVVGVGLRNREGHTLLGPGMTLTGEYIGRLRQLGYCALWIDDEDTRDIPYQDLLSESTRLAATAAIQDTFAITAHEAESLRSLSVQEVRARLEARRVQQAIHDTGLVDRLGAQVDQLVGEVLDRPVLTGLGSLRTHSGALYRHSLDVAVTATMIGRLLGLGAEMLRKLAVGCILHDIGAIFLGTEATHELDEPTPRVRDHPVLGYLFIRDTLQLGPLAAHVAYQHHEWQDGSGYPRGLKGAHRALRGIEVHLPGRIHPMAEIAAVADVHDACAAPRPDAAPRPPDQVWARLRQAADSRLNREIVERFLQVLPPYPVGTLVAIAEGRWKDHVGVVARVNAAGPHRPLLRLLVNPRGERIPPVEVDLSRDDSPIRGVLRLHEEPPAAPPPASA